MKLTTFFFFLSVFFASCSTGLQDRDAEFLDEVLNTEWELIEMDGENLSDMDSPPSLKFSNEEYKIGGRGGCNSYGADIEVQDEKISINNIISTKMFCDGKMDTESKYFSILEKIDDIKVKDQKLHLSSGNKSVLVFERLK
ncbi:MAG: META domain-containing protein [Ignavibacteriaceae bacterium]